MDAFTKAREGSIKSIKNAGLEEKEEAKIIDLYESLLCLPKDQRHLVLLQFCHYCSRNDPGCVCWNDE